jgi:hypothetical protein
MVMAPASTDTIDDLTITRADIDGNDELNKIGDTAVYNFAYTWSNSL